MNVEHIELDSQPSACRPYGGHENGECRWPGDRLPAPSDAEVAYQNLDPKVVQIFKQAMFADEDARRQRKFPSLENARVFFSQPDSSNVVRHHKLS